MPNAHRAIADARLTIEKPTGNLSGGDVAKFEAVLAAVEALAAEFAAFRTKTIGELDELRDELADMRPRG
jgi:hypothetical protein